MYDVNIAVNLAAMLMIGILFLLFLRERSLLQGLSARFFPMLGVDLLLLAANAGRWYAHLKGNLPVCLGINSFACMCYYAELALFLSYGVAYVSRSASVSHWYTRIGTAVCAVSAAGWTLSAFTGSFYTLSETGVVVPGRLYLLGQLGGYLVIGLAVLLIVRYYRVLGSSIALLFLSFALFPVAAAVVREFWRGVDLMPAMLSLSLLLAFNFVHVQESLELREREVQTEKDRIAAALSQLRPQALYDTLENARTLCETDSAAAQRTIAAFADNLRSALDQFSAESISAPKHSEQEEDNHEYFGS